MAASVPSVSEAVLLLDIEKSSGLTAKYGNVHAHQVKEGLRRVIRPAAARFGASLVKFTGDGYFVTFPSESSAVSAAIAILQAAPASIEQRAPGAEVHYRIGIAFGALTVLEDGDRQGGAANLAAQLEAADLATLRPPDDPSEEAGSLDDLARDRILICQHTFSGLPEDQRRLTRPLGWLEMKHTGALIPVYSVGWREARRIELPPYVEPPPFDVPLPSEHFVGRTPVVAEVAALLEHHRLVSVVGPPGIGKTQIACAVGHQASQTGAFPEGSLFVDLQGASDADTVLQALALALQLDGVATPHDLAMRIPSRRCLVVLDNLEDALHRDRTGVRALLGELLAHSREPRFLVTSREHTGLTDEHVRRVAPLAQPDAGSLFRSLAEAKGYHWQDGDDARLDSLLDDWENVPLAIVLAAGRLADDGSLTRLAGKWDRRRTEALRVPGLAKPDRLADLDYSISLSYLALPESGDARRLMGLFGRLPAGASEDLLQALLGDHWEGPTTQLVRRSLLDPGVERWTMLAPLRSYASRLTWPEGSRDEHTLQEHFRRLADEHATRLARRSGGESHRLLTTQLPNLEAAMDRATARRDDEALAALADALRGYYRSSGAASHGKERLEAGAAAARRAGRRLREANCLYSLGEVHLRRDEYAAARRRHEEALPIYREAGDRQGEANCVRALGDVHLQLAEYAAARGRYEEALPIYREIADRLGEAHCIRSLGDVHRMSDEYATARERYEEALPAYRETGHRLGEAHCIKSLGDVHRMLGEYGRAREQFEEARVVYGETGSRLGEANCLWSLGDLHLQLGEHATARSRYEEALAVFREVGARVGEANCIWGLGGVHLELAEYTAAGERYAEALPIYRETGDRLGEANCIRSLGDLHLQLAEHAAARARYEEALAAYRLVGDRLDEAGVAESLGRLAADQGDSEAARAHYETAVQLYDGIGFEGDATRVGAEIARLRALDDHSESGQD